MLRTIFLSLGKGYNRIGHMRKCVKDKIKYVLIISTFGESLGNKKVGVGCGRSLSSVWETGNLRLETGRKSENLKEPVT